MPFKSEAQRKYLYANHPDIAKRWSKEEKQSARQGALERRARRGNKHSEGSGIQTRSNRKG